MDNILIIGHPGHELRAFRWMEQARPVVHVLTDGSGSLSEGRIESTAKTVNSAGAQIGSYFGCLKDGVFYQDLLDVDPSHFVEALFEIYQSIVEAGPRELMIVGDAIEGYNTAHDMTRYMINILCARLRAEGYVVRNYAFNLVDNPSESARNAKEGDIVLKLSAEDFVRKLDAARNYPELKEEVEIAIAQVGEVAFKNEVFTLIDASAPVIPTPSGALYYEEFGRKRVAEGKYEELILFESHMRPFSQALESAFNARF
ncbi:MAG TPA: hypothetical protein DCX06_02015 [Opitutae bacterium]|nr:hypothetical protein [Opitutae bacterium]